MNLEINKLLFFCLLGILISPSSLFRVNPESNNVSFKEGDWIKYRFNYVQADFYSYSHETHENVPIITKYEFITDILILDVDPPNISFREVRRFRNGSIFGDMVNTADPSIPNYYKNYHQHF